MREQEDYISGQELCEHFGVSRTAVWKAIGQLKKEGYEIEAVRNKGYRLIEDQSRTERFGYSELASRLTTKWVGHPLVFLERTTSTNILAKNAAEESAGSGTLFVADMQTAGRGRRGRTWESPAGSNLYFTLLLKPELEPDRASMLTLVMALAVAEGIKCTLARTGNGQEADRVAIKWPNDIVVDGRKVCGILTEMSLSVEQGSIQYVVIGVGVNVKPQQFPDGVAETATTLCEAFGTEVSRTELLANICSCFEKHVAVFEKEKDLSELREAYDALLINRDRQVRVLDPKGEFTGIARGINDRGELLVETEDGRVETIYAGEVSVRGIYGYV